MSFISGGRPLESVCIEQSRHQVGAKHCSGLVKRCQGQTFSMQPSNHLHYLKKPGGLFLQTPGLHHQRGKGQGSWMLDLDGSGWGSWMLDRGP